MIRNGTVADKEALKDIKIQAKKSELIVNKLTKKNNGNN